MPRLSDDYAKDGGYTGTEAEFAAKLADATYMRLSCGVIDDTSIITVNEEIT